MKHSSLLARAAAATATLSTVVAGAVIITSTPAQAALKETNYGFYTYAFGTGANADLAGVTSGPQGNSFIGCTRLAGKSNDEALTSSKASEYLGVGAMTSHSQTFKRANGDVGSYSTNKVTSIKLGGSTGPAIVIKGLQTESEAWADKNGKLHTSNAFKLSDITAKTGVAEVDNALNQVNVTFNDLLKTIVKLPGDQLVLPGVGRIAMGRKSSKIGSTMAKSNATALRIVLSIDGVEGNGDDVMVVVGRSHARVYENVPAAVMGGQAYTTDVKVLGDLVGIGRLARLPLDCRGTNGKILTNAAAGGENAGRANVLGVGASRSRVYGAQGKNGSAKAWTEASVKDLELDTTGGDLQLTNIVARGTMTKSKTGKITKSTAGTRVGSVTYDGTDYDLDPGQDKLDIPGLGTITLGIVENPTSRTMKVTAVRIVLAASAQEETGLATINLGVAEVRLRRL